MLYWIPQLIDESVSELGNPSVCLSIKIACQLFCLPILVSVFSSALPPLLSFHVRTTSGARPSQQQPVAAWRRSRARGTSQPTTCSSSSTRWAEKGVRERGLDANSRKHVRP